MIKIVKTNFGYNVLTLMFGTIVAQAIPIAISPILTRLYTPEDFGVLALYMAVVVLLAVVVTGRYELAVMLPKDEDDAEILVVLSLWITIVLSFCLFLIILIFNKDIASFLGNEDLSSWLYLSPLSVFLTGFYNTFNCWLNRNKYYADMSKNKIAQSTMTGGGQLSFGWSAIGGLIHGVILGQLLTVFMLVNKFTRLPRKKPIEWLNLSKMRALAARYKNHPYHLLPAHWLGAVAMQLPIFIMMSAFGAAITGFYSMAQRMISMPTSLVANAIGDVYRQQASVSYQEKGEFYSLFVSTLSKTILISIIPFFILYLIAPDLFAFAFGESWRVAGEYAQIIVVSSFVQFIFTPVDKGALIVGATAYIFYWHLLRLFLFCILFVFVKIKDLSVEQIIWMIALINIILYIIDGVVEYRFSKLNGKKNDR